ncbi:HHR249Cp [Eremothecium sinecaudum]|uniref:ubiquitinyl hydrolase 1 n=1 Tax=Eremothecium sinecaudum TaxID=45286 RepID=A0A0X8HX45_9SACH|nr:HHR249Cp [Eremothecium sinecaudum]AMD23018.1 HHR249Cp [Eremothecium sinecaudum]
MTNPYTTKYCTELQEFVQEVYVNNVKNYYPRLRLEKLIELLEHASYLLDSYHALAEQGEWNDGVTAFVIGAFYLYLIVPQSTEFQSRNLSYSMYVELRKKYENEPNMTNITELVQSMAEDLVQVSQSDANVHKVGQSRQRAYSVPSNASNMSSAPMDQFKMLEINEMGQNSKETMWSAPRLEPHDQLQVVGSQQNGTNSLHVPGGIDAQNGDPIGYNSDASDSASIHEWSLPSQHKSPKDSSHYSETNRFQKLLTEKLGLESTRVSPVDDGASTMLTRLHEASCLKCIDLMNILRTNMRYSTLLVDLRLKRRYEKNHIVATNLINIDPNMLWDPERGAPIASVTELEKKVDNDLFTNRSRFNYIVCYTDSYTYMVSEFPYELTFFRLVYSGKPQLITKCLLGGYDQWKAFLKDYHKQESINVDDYLWRPYGVGKKIKQVAEFKEPSTAVSSAQGMHPPPPTPVILAPPSQRMPSHLPPSVLAQFASANQKGPELPGGIQIPAIITSQCTPPLPPQNAPPLPPKNPLQPLQQLKLSGTANAAQNNPNFEHSSQVPGKTCVDYKRNSQVLQPPSLQQLPPPLPPPLPHAPPHVQPPAQPPALPLLPAPPLPQSQQTQNVPPIIPLKKQPVPLHTGVQNQEFLLNGSKLMPSAIPRGEVSSVEIVPKKKVPYDNIWRNSDVPNSRGKYTNSAVIEGEGDKKRKSAIADWALTATQSQPKSQSQSLPQSQPQPQNHFVVPTIDASANEFVSLSITGLRNMGSTCYINSMLQCLFSTTQFRNLFLSNMYSRYLKSSEVEIMSRSFYMLFRKMYMNGGCSVVPSGFLRTCDNLKPDLGIPNAQQDTQEFLLFLLDRLHEELSHVAAVGNDYSQLLLHDNTHLNVNDKEYNKWFEENIERNGLSPIDDIFQGQMENHLSCQRCGYSSYSYSTFYVLSLALPNHVAKTFTKSKKLRLEDCINFFTCDEVLTGQNAWDCPKCGLTANGHLRKDDKPKKRTLFSSGNDSSQKNSTTNAVPSSRSRLFKFASKTKCASNSPPNADGKNSGSDKYKNQKKLTTIKTLNFITLPRVLIIHLSRFIYDLTKKNSTVVTYPLVLNIVLKNNEVASFRLYSIVNHSGTLVSGHYTALVNKDKDHEIKKGKQKWYYFDDEVVKCDVNHGNFDEGITYVSSGDVYVLFYERIPNDSSPTS